MEKSSSRAYDVRTSHHSISISSSPTSSPSINIMTVPDQKPPDDVTTYNSNNDVWVPTTNEVIVYSTLFILALVLITCAMMYISKPSRSRQGSPTNSNDEMEEGLLPGDNDQINNTVSPNSSVIDQVKKKKKKIIRKKKVKPDSLSQQGLDFDIESNSVIDSDASGASSEASSLLETKGGRIPGAYKVDPDLTLLTAFTSVLRQGITISLHTIKGVKQINLTLSGTELKWQSLKVFVRKISKLDVKDILYIEMGKKTTSFKLPGASSVLDDYCFSLITNQESIDLEASSKVERDALAQGFAILIARARYSG